MIKVGMLGFGFMGSQHFGIYQDMPDVEVKCIYDLDPEKVKKGDTAAGNIGDGGEAVDISGINVTDDPDEVIGSDVDIVDVCLPTFLHAEHAVKALDAGKNVMCEKPMALDLNECQSMIDARDRSGKKLMIGHCIRFWPEYVEVKKMLDERRYGLVNSAAFKRLSPTPAWSCQNWILNQDKSGGAVLDLHVHDVDFVLNVFGMPGKVTSFGNINVAAKNSGVDYVLSRFSMDSSALVVAEGGWHFHEQFPFSMTFTIRCEDATICFDAAGQNTLAVYKADGSAEYPEVSGRTGWEEEISYFVDCVANDKPVEFSPAEDSMLAVEVALAERESVVNNTSVVLA